MGKREQRLKGLRKELLSGIGVPERHDFTPDAFQLDAIESLRAGYDTLVIAPTGAGKTYIAVEAIRRVIGSGERAVYTAPLKALSNSKYAEFKKLFEPAHSVGLLTGDRKIEGDADVVVATTEIYRNELYNIKTTTEYGVVVLDEFHYLADSQRGAVWEESVILSARSSALLMLSASISNARQVADWIEETRGKKVTIIRVDERPVELRFAFLHPEFGVIPLQNQNGDVEREVVQFYAAASKRKKQQKRRFGNQRSRRGKGKKRGKS